jgi:hypothetical protein
VSDGMVRNRRSSLFFDIIFLVGKLPWGVSLLLVVIVADLLRLQVLSLSTACPSVHGVLLEIVSC